MLKITRIFIDADYRDAASRVHSGELLCGSQTPVISWAASSDIGGVQSGYSLTILQGGETLWETGWVENERGQSVVYGGKPFKRGSDIIVLLAVRSDAGEESEVLTCSFRYIGIDDWNADWVASPEDSERRAIYFHRLLKPSRPVGEISSVDAYICGLGYALLTVNGVAYQRVLPLSPSVSVYNKTAYYARSSIETYGADETGGFDIEIAVGDGWRRNDAEIFKTALGGRKIEFFGQPVMSALFEISYRDGEVERFVTGADWTWTYGPIVMNSLYDGVTFDARIHDNDEKAVQVMPCPCEKLLPDTLQPIAYQEIYDARTIFSPSSGVYVFDFGQNIAGIPIIRLPKGMKAGQSITVTCHELLDEDGTLYTPTLRDAKCTDTYIASGEEDNPDSAVWMPEFTYHGFRYAQVTGWNGVPELSDITALALYTDVKNNSFFECGSALLNKIQQNVVQTEKSNIHSILTDCPQRDERMGWLNDATVRFTETPYNFNIGRLFPKILRDIRDGQRADGSIQCTAPYVFGGDPADPVCSSYLVAGMEAYRQTGDIRTLSEGYDGWAAWENKLLSCHDESEPYLVNYSYYGDWASPSYACIYEEHAQSAVTPGVFMSSGYSYFNCLLLAFFADTLGFSSDAVKWRDTAEKIKAAILKKWWHEENAVMATGSQACQAFALWLDIIPAAKAAEAARVLRDDLAGHDYKLTTGNLCTLYMLETLTKFGYINEAYTLMVREEYPSFGYEIQNEATTIWERFELKKNPGMNSHNHPMYGSVGRWFYSGICGLTFSASDSSKATVDLPKLPEKLLSAQCGAETRFGMFGVRWVKRFGKHILYLTVPFGMTCAVNFLGVRKELSSGWHIIEG